MNRRRTGGFCSKREEGLEGGGGAWNLEMAAWFLKRLSAGSSQEGGCLRGDKELDEGGRRRRKEDLFEGACGHETSRKKGGEHWEACVQQLSTNHQ